MLKPRLETSFRSKSGGGAKLYHKFNLSQGNKRSCVDQKAFATCKYLTRTTKFMDFMDLVDDLEKQYIKSSNDRRTDEDC